VKSVGALTGSTRTADQTETALFWVENSTDTWNRIARIAGAAHHNNLIENARLFALLNMAGADGIIAGFKAKYTFQFWATGHRDSECRYRYQSAHHTRPKLATATTDTGVSRLSLEPFDL